jgi:hypothetical protein
MSLSFDDVRSAASRALGYSGSAPGIPDDCGWACAWLEACGYPGLEMLAEALDETPREGRQPAFEIDVIGIDLRNVSCVFSAPRLISIATERGRIFLRNVRHGLYLLPFAVRANMGIGCPVDPSFAIGGERTKNPYVEKLAAAEESGIAVDASSWARITRLPLD